MLEEMGIRASVDDEIGNMSTQEGECEWLHSGRLGHARAVTIWPVAPAMSPDTLPIHTNVLNDVGFGDIPYLCLHRHTLAQEGGRYS